MSHMMIRRALLSVSDKSCIEELANVLVTFGVEILASGGTADRLKRAGIKFRPVEEYTGNPEAFDGRMKTISFQLESAILFDRRSPAHVRAGQGAQDRADRSGRLQFLSLRRGRIEGRGRGGSRPQHRRGRADDAVRSAAKNFYASVTVLTDPSDYQGVMAEALRALSGSRSRLETRRRLAVKAFDRTMSYDRAILEAFNRQPLRYGENPHQQGYFVPDTSADPAMTWELVEPSGLELSYNNILDAQAALGAMRDARLAAEPGHGAVAIVKHNNPCGLATAPTIVEAFTRAWAGDPVSAFGGVIALSSQLTVECARLFDEKFVEVLMAPDFEDGAIEELRRKKKKLRVLRIGRSRGAAVVAGRVPARAGRWRHGWCSSSTRGLREDFRGRDQDQVRR